MTVGSTFIVGDYEYTVTGSATGHDNVSAKVVDKTKSSYGTITSPFSHDGTDYVITSLKECYRGCTNITAIPQMDFSDSGPNVEIDYCFYGCTSLLTAPIASRLPHIWTASCAFWNCTSLTSVELPATCRNCDNMFYGCVSLTTVNRIPDYGQYNDMFRGCTALESVPDFPDPLHSYYSGISETFRGCTSLKEPPALPSVIYNGSGSQWSNGLILQGLFQGCTSLESAPSSFPQNTKSLKLCFSGCASLEAPPSIPSTVTDMYGCFDGCIGIASPPSIPSGVTNMRLCFNGCTALEYAPTIPQSVTNMRACFQNCSSITSPANIPSGVTDIENCFYYCTSMTGTMTVANTPTNYAYAFTGIQNDVYVILTGSASESVWRGIASQYTHVFIFSDNSAPTCMIAAFRCDSNGDADEEGEYANVTAVATLYEDSVPSGTNSLQSKTFKLDNAVSTPTWTQTVVSLTYTLNAVISLGDTNKHVFAFSATDAFDAQSIEVSVILVSAAPALDFVHGSTDNGVAIGKIARTEGIVDSAWDYWEHGERIYPTFTRSSWSISSDESTLPVTPCFVLSTGDGALYWCSGSGIVRLNITPNAVRNVGANLNDMKPGDTWWGNGFTNAPDSGWYEVYCHGDYQVAYGFTGNTTAPTMYLRSHVNGVWQPWFKGFNAYGDTVTGSVTLQSSNIDRDGADPSSDTYTTSHIRLVDKDGELIGLIRGRRYTDGRQYLQLAAYNENNGTEVANFLQIIVAKDGTRSYAVDSPSAFRSAIGALSTSGGSVSNDFNLANNGVLYAQSTSNDTSLASRSSQQFQMFGLRDKNGRFSSYLQTVYQTDGSVETQIGARCYNSGNITNMISMRAYRNGTYTYYVTDKDKFRSAISAAAASSDRRLKSDILPLGEDAVEFVESLKPFVYTINGKREVGLIAQDVYESDKWGTRMAFETVEGVDGLDDWEKMDDGSPTWKLEYIRIIPPLVSAVQSANKRIESLESEIALLKAEIAELKGI